LLAAPGAVMAVSGREHRDRELFDHIATQYALKDTVESTRGPRRYQLAFALEPIWAQIRPNPTIVEVACGFGASAQYLAGRYGKYLGIDYSSQIIEAASSSHSNLGASAKFVCANVKDVDVGAEKADLIFAVGALHHMTDLDGVFASMKKMAAPSAMFVALEPYRGNPFVQSLRFLRGKVDRSYSEEQTYFSRAELEELCTRNGLTEASTELEGFLTPPFAQVLLKPEWLAERGSRAAIAIDSLLDRHLPAPLRWTAWNVVLRARFPG
jgi:ubiquinone/menaquinone biosynthesis C-methylase UbiE